MRTLEVVILLSCTLAVSVSPSRIRSDASRGVTGKDPAWALHAGGGPSQVALIQHVIDTSCDNGVATAFIREFVMNGVSAVCPSDDQGSCFAQNYLLEHSCPTWIIVIDWEGGEAKILSSRLMREVTWYRINMKYTTILR